MSTTGGGAMAQLARGSSDSSAARRGGAAGRAAAGMGAARAMAAAAASAASVAGSGGAVTATRRVWVRDRIDAMRWRPGCLVAEGEATSSASGAVGGGGGGSDATSGFLARLDDGTMQVLIRNDIGLSIEFCSDLVQNSLVQRCFGSRCVIFVRCGVSDRSAHPFCTCLPAVCFLSEKGQRCIAALKNSYLSLTFSRSLGQTASWTSPRLEELPLPLRPRWRRFPEMPDPDAVFEIPPQNSPRLRGLFDGMGATQASAAEEGAVAVGEMIPIQEFAKSLRRLTPGFAAGNLAHRSWASYRDLVAETVGFRVAEVQAVAAEWAGIAEAPELVATVAKVARKAQRVTPPAPFGGTSQQLAPAALASIPRRGQRQREIEQVPVKVVVTGTAVAIAAKTHGEAPGRLAVWKLLVRRLETDQRRLPQPVAIRGAQDGAVRRCRSSLGSVVARRPPGGPGKHGGLGPVAVA